MKAGQLYWRCKVCEKTAPVNASHPAYNKVWIPGYRIKARCRNCQSNTVQVIVSL